MNCINDRRTKGFLSLDALLEAGDPAKFRPLSDCGDGARQIRSAPDRRADFLSTLSTSAEEKLAKARDRLVANGLARLLPILDLIVLNGRNRKESIRQLSKIWHVKLNVARRKYYRGSRTLLTFFSPNKIRGEMTLETSE